MSLTPRLTGLLAAIALMASANAVLAQDPWGGAFTQRSTFYNPFDASSRFGALGGFDALRSSNPFLDLAPVVVPTGPSVVGNSSSSTSSVGSVTTTLVAPAATETVASSTASVSTLELSSSSSVMVAPAMSLRPPFQPPVRSPFRPAPRPPLIP